MTMELLAGLRTLAEQISGRVTRVQTGLAHLTGLTQLLLEDRSARGHVKRRYLPKGLTFSTRGDLAQRKWDADVAPYSNRAICIVPPRSRVVSNRLTRLMSYDPLFSQLETITRKLQPMRAAYFVDAVEGAVVYPHVPELVGDGDRPDFHFTPVLDAATKPPDPPNGLRCTHAVFGGVGVRGVSRQVGVWPRNLIAVQACYSLGEELHGAWGIEFDAVDLIRGAEIDWGPTEPALVLCDATGRVLALWDAHNILGACGQRADLSAPSALGPAFERLVSSPGKNAAIFSRDSGATPLRMLGSSGNQGPIELSSGHHVIASGFCLNGPDWQLVALTPIELETRSVDEHDDPPERLRDKLSELRAELHSARIHHVQATHEALKSEAYNGIIGIALGAYSEMKNLLPMIVCYAGFIREEGGPAASEDATMILELTEKAALALNEFMDLDIRQSWHERRGADPAQALRALEVMLRATLSPKTDLVLTIAPQLPRVTADLRVLWRVYLSLVERAAIKAPAGSTVTMTLDTTAEGVRLCLQHEGQRLGPRERAVLTEGGTLYPRKHSLHALAAAAAALRESGGAFGRVEASAAGTNIEVFFAVKE